MGNNYLLNDKTAIVTGGGSGIGAAISKKFAENGAHVHILDIHTKNAMAVMKQTDMGRQQVEIHECDVSSRSETANLIGLIAETQKIDILVNNAGLAHVGNVESTKEEDLDYLYAVNIKGIVCLW